MNASTDPITITPVDAHDAAIGVLRTSRKMELSAEDCRAIVGASGLTGRVIALEHASDKARKAEIGESTMALQSQGLISILCAVLPARGPNSTMW